jgi:hypothetical protein
MDWAVTIYQVQHQQQQQQQQQQLWLHTLVENGRGHNPVMLRW